MRFQPVAHRARFEQLPEGSATVKVLAGTATDFDILELLPSVGDWSGCRHRRHD